MKIHWQVRVVNLIFAAELFTVILLAEPFFFLIPITDPFTFIYEWWYLFLAETRSGGIRFGTGDRNWIYIVPYFFLVLVLSFLCLAVCLALSSLFDMRRRRSLGQLITLDQSQESIIVSKFSEDESLHSLTWSDIIRVVRSDKSIGACVVGVVKQKLVISVGLLVLLKKGAISSKQIVAHEYAHMLNFDKLLPGVIGLSFPYVVYDTLARPVSGSQAIVSSQGTMAFLLIVALGVAKLALFSSFLQYVVRRREHFADLFASRMTKSTEAYIELLESSSSNKEDYFHPSPFLRAQFLRNFPSSLNTSRSILVCACAIGVGVALLSFGISQFSVSLGLGVFRPGVQDATLTMLTGVSFIAVGLFNVVVLSMLRTLALNRFSSRRD